MHCAIGSIKVWVPAGKEAAFALTCRKSGVLVRLVLNYGNLTEVYVNDLRNENGKSAFVGTSPMAASTFNNIETKFKIPIETHLTLILENKGTRETQVQGFYIIEED